MARMLHCPTRGVLSWGVALALMSGVGLGGEARGQQAPPDAQPAVQAPAPTRANIVSTGARQWDVLVDGEAVCATPCTGPLYPQQFVVLQSQEVRPVILEVGNLPAGDLIVSAKPLQSGKYAGGVVATTLGGMALAIGITFVSVGLAKDRNGFTIAGLITGGAGVVVLPGGIYLMLTAVPSVSVERAAVPPGAGVGVGGAF
jgi:hypothetical protein